jgi:hypothetical protein
MSDTQSLFSPTTTPTDINLTDGGTLYELGLKFRSAKAGQIQSIRYWKTPSETGTHVGKIWSSTGQLLASVTFTNETASGWQEQALATPLTIVANTTYVVSVNSNGFYARTLDAFNNVVTSGDLSTVADGSNGVFGTPGTLPTQSNRNSNYYRDIVFSPLAQEPGGNPLPVMAALSDITDRLIRIENQLIADTRKGATRYKRLIPGTETVILDKDVAFDPLTGFTLTEHQEPPP